MQTIKKKGFSPSKKSEPQLMTMANKALDLVSLHQKNLTRAAAVLAAVVVIAAGYTLFQSNNDKKASAMLAAAQGFYQEQAAGAAPDFAKALEGYRDVFKKYPRTTSGAIARFYIGSCLVQLNQPTEALREYEALAKNKFVDKGLAGLAYQRMGYVYSALGKQSEAITSFEQAEAVLGPGLATVELAKLYERAGNGAEAQKKYKVIAEKLGGTTFAPEARGAAATGAAAPSAPGPAGK
jgi:tetratricopeptide (TPR) repeat protein